MTRTADDDLGRLPRLAATAVLAASVLLAAVEVGRVAVVGSLADVVVALVATAVFLPLHVWHLRYGLRGERPPRSGRTLALMAAAHLGALLLIGPAWSFMLATLATSALIVLTPRWALAVLVLCAVGPVLGDALHPDGGGAFGSSVSYLVISVVFRAVIQFALVWLVAAVHQLAASRAALAREATERERARVEAEVGASLQRGMGELAQASRRSRDALDGEGRAAVLLALDRVLVLSRATLVDVRRAVAEARSTAQHPAAAGLAQAARDARTPVGRGLAWRRARVAAVAVHVMALGFLITAGLGNARFSPAEPATVVVVVALWALVSGLQVSLSWDLAHGRRPHHGWLRVLAILAGVVALQFFGPQWESAVWLVFAAAMMALDRRALIAVTALVAIALVVYDTWLVLTLFPDPTAGLIVWNFWYMTALVGLTSFGLYASARLVAVVDSLDATRAALGEQAVAAERRRLSSDLHDVLGQTLTAISLKADLARRLVDHDRHRAAAELDDLVALADGQAGELAAVTQGDRQMVFEAEVTNAIGLLEAAGIEVEPELAGGPLDPDTSALLGWAVREGATNILRHARAGHCAIRFAQGERGVELELRNDGAGGPVALGTGLSGLADRVCARGGDTRAEVLDDGHFVLRVSIPEPVPA